MLGIGNIVGDTSEGFFLRSDYVYSGISAISRELDSCYSPNVVLQKYNIALNLREMCIISTPPSYKYFLIKPDDCCVMNFKAIDGIKIHKLREGGINASI